MIGHENCGISRTHAGSPDFGDLRLDFGNNDYYNHSIPGCTDIKNSPLLP